MLIPPAFPPNLPCWKSASEVDEKVLQPSRTRRGTSEICIEVEGSFGFLGCLPSVQETATAGCQVEDQSHVNEIHRLLRQI